MEATAPAAGWFEDPHGSGQLRWWDGSQWTEHLTPNPEAPAQAAPIQAAPVQAAPAVVPAQQPELDASPVVERVTSRPSIPPRTLAIAGGILAVLVAALVLGPKLFGGTGPSGPPLTAQQYAAKISEFENVAGESAKFGSDSTPDDLRKAASMMRDLKQLLEDINPPEAIATEHRTLIGQIGTFADNVDKIAANPKDEAAAFALLGDALAMAATMQSIEQKLGVSLGGDTATAGAVPGSTGAPSTAGSTV